jgi:hypothetical protein
MGFGDFCCPWVAGKAKVMSTRTWVETSNQSRAIKNTTKNGRESNSAEAHAVNVRSDAPTRHHHQSATTHDTATLSECSSLQSPSSPLNSSSEALSSKKVRKKFDGSVWRVWGSESGIGVQIWPDLAVPIWVDGRRSAKVAGASCLGRF